MISINDVLNLTPEGLRATQHTLLKSHVLTQLEHITNLIKSEDYHAVDNCTFFSPSGEDTGADNVCINFGTKLHPLDIFDVVSKLKQFKEET